MDDLGLEIEDLRDTKRFKAREDDSSGEFRND